MKQNQISQYAAQFAAASLTSLVEQFNAQVGNRGFCSARAMHDQALIQEFIDRGIDVSAIYDGKTLSFARTIKLDEAQRKIIVR